MLFKYFRKVCTASTKHCMEKNIACVEKGKFLLYSNGITVLPPQNQILGRKLHLCPKNQDLKYLFIWLNIPLSPDQNDTKSWRTVASLFNSGLIPALGTMW